MDRSIVDGLVPQSRCNSQNRVVKKIYTSTIRSCVETVHGITQSPGGETVEWVPLEQKASVAMGRVVWHARYLLGSAMLVSHGTRLCTGGMTENR